VEDESPWVGPGPQGFCRVFGPVGFFVGGFFSIWAFLTLPTWARAKPCGLDQIDTSTLNTVDISKPQLKLSFPRVDL